MTAPLLHQWNIATRTCKVCGEAPGVSPTCSGAPATATPAAVAATEVSVSSGAETSEPSGLPPVAVPPDLTPLIPNPTAAVEQPIQTAEEVRATIEAAAAEAQEVAQATVKVDLQFPAIGFIDPATELEKMRQLVNLMPEHERSGYPEKIRAKLLAHQAKPDAPAVTDEELALAIYIRRTVDSALTPEELEAKATGRKPKAEGAAKAPKAAAKAKKEKPNLDDLLGGL